MRYLSLFSGMEACTEAWHSLGWEPVAFSEIDKDACRFLEHKYPDVPNLGSVTDITDDDIKSLGHIDLVVGGSPCQDLSVAGKGAGLAGSRSGLFFEQLRIFHAARNISNARFLLWENVPGAFSSNQKRDFGAVVAAMAGTAIPDPPQYGWGKTGVAVGDNGMVEWSTLDAQFFGVAQRRRRVFALLDIGDWASRPPILFNAESLSGDSEKGGKARKDIAGTLTQSFGKRGNDALTARHDSSEDGYRHAVAYKVAPTLETTCHDYSRADGFVSVADLIDHQVRRLTPLECQRLQGFPDDYFDGIELSDTAKYRLLGNSMAVPVMRWIGEQINIKTYTSTED